MKKITVFVALIALSAGIVFAGTIDVKSSIRDNTKSIVKELSMVITTTGTGLDLQSIDVTATESSNDVSSAIGDAALLFVLNSGSATIQAGVASATYFAEIRASEYALIPLSTNTATLFFKSAADTTNNVQYGIFER